MITYVKTLPIIHPRIESAENIEDVLCLGTLIANGELPPSATLEDSQNYFKNEANGDCTDCPFNLTCLACIINE